MMNHDELAILRRAYAKQILAVFSVTDDRVERAFAEVSREAFLGPGPWPVLRSRRGYVATPSNDPVYLYADLLVGISPSRHINNGQPSLHAVLMAQAAPSAGDHVVHIGTGTGYYTAILAHLVGPSGRVTGIEFEPDIAVSAAENLSDYPNVTILEGDGASLPFSAADVVYVNAGATRPADIWLDRLKDGARLILPLTTDKSWGAGASEKIDRRGAVFRITRHGADFFATRVSAVAIYPCKGLRDPASEQALAAAFEMDDGSGVTRLYRMRDCPSGRYWLRAQNWCLAYD